MKLILSLSLTISFAAGLFAQTPNASVIFDKQIGNVEGEVVSLAEAMPADKYNFAPTQGAFTGVRTFEQEVKHIAFTLNMVSNAMLDRPAPQGSGTAENGPDSIKGKDAAVKYLKDAFAQAHKAVATLNNNNLLQETADPFNPKGKRTRVDSAGILSWHTFDHYGQMVEYARMNGVIPPASQPARK
ncbi:MAG: DinB family protein [Acidobacteriota bacterium]|nr:DinB family protein [Acidobacteriota bacterium]